ncbi:MAG: RluA family pseudouridine synthase [Fimbriimonadales bacterium]
MREQIVQESGLRLDRWLAHQHPEISRERWQEWIAQGEVQVNGRAVKPAYRLQRGDQVVYSLPPDRPPDIDLRPEAIPLQIAYEDEVLLVVNKPRGLTVHPAPGHPHGTLVNALLAYAPRLAHGSAEFRPGIVHRLDKDTTGLLIVAKTDRAHHLLSAELQCRAIHRRYLALVWGTPQWERHTVDLPIGRHPVNRKKMSVHEGDTALRYQARPARTHFTVRRRWNRFALVEAELETGRTHQVRVHLSAIGLPIVGDPLYGGVRTPPSDLSPELVLALKNLQGQLLHAYQLEFIHPFTHQPIHLEAPLPDDFQQVLTLLSHQQEGSPPL